MKIFKSCFFLFIFAFISHAEESKLANSESKIIFLGDSLTEGYGVSKASTYTSLIQEKFKTDNLHWKAINAGISGSTTASASSRIRWLLKDPIKPKIVVILLGSNDGLRGQPIKSIEDNLSSAIDTLKKEKIKVILAELWMPPNYGNSYSNNFKKMFQSLSKKTETPLMPYILKNVAGKPALNIADGIHPNEKGHKIIADEVYKFIKPYLR
ncbi:MAG: arylesterase [Bdellovibrionales bacterium]|nr:arylesterase [Bdellovibrionales bacterium]